MAQTTEEKTEELKERTKKLVERRKISEALQKAKKEYKSEKYDVTKTTRAKDVAISKVARKAISLAAPKGGLVKALTKSAEEGRGRGRPSGTYKARVLPSGRVVKVPTALYKKMLAQEKANIRLARVQQQLAAQAQAEQIAMQQDPRYQMDSGDQFLEEPDQVHEMNVEMAKQQAEMVQYAPEQRQYVQQRPSATKRFVVGLSRLGSNIGALGTAQRQPMYDQYGRQVMPQQIRRAPSAGEIRQEPRVTAISSKANLLLVPNKFNNPRNSTIKNNVGRRYRR